MPKIQKGEYIVSVAIADGTQANHRNLVWLHNIAKITIENKGYNVSLYEFEAKTTVNVLEKGRIKYY